jgi:hypothetical protein
MGRDLLGKLSSVVSARDIIEQGVKAYHGFSNITAQLTCLQLVFSALESVKPTEYSGILVKTLINKIAFIFSEKNSDKKFSDIIMKIMKVSLIKNGESSREYFTLLSPSLQNKLIDYAEKNEPDILHLLNEEPLDHEIKAEMDEHNEGIPFDQHSDEEVNHKNEDRYESKPCLN